MILGAVLAGGRSSRFGSDKAAAMLDGRTLLDRTVAALGPQVDALVVVGRRHAVLDWVADRPAADLGPLGGLNGALHAAAAGGYAWVASVPCDAPRLPADLVAVLRAAGGPAFVPTLPVVGLWPAAGAPLLDAHLASGESRSMRSFATAIGAVAVPLAEPMGNINTPADLDALRAER